MRFAVLWWSIDHPNQVSKNMFCWPLHPITQRFIRILVIGESVGADWNQSEFMIQLHSLSFIQVQNVQWWSMICHWQLYTHKFVNGFWFFWLVFVFYNYRKIFKCNNLKKTKGLIRWSKARIMTVLLTQRRNGVNRPSNHVAEQRRYTITTHPTPTGEWPITSRKPHRENL